MASYLYRTRAMFQIPRAIPTIMARNQTTSTTGKSAQSTNTTTSANRTANTTTATGTNTPGNQSSQSYRKNTEDFSFINSPAGKIGSVVVISVGLYAAYKMLYANKGASPSVADLKNTKK